MNWILILAALLGTAIMFLIDWNQDGLTKVKARLPFYGLLFLVSSVISQLIVYPVTQFIVVLLVAIFFCFIYKFFINARKTTKVG